MAETPAADTPPPPPPPAEDAPTPIDRDVWLACATPLSRIPAVGSQVYYFRHGHSEQCPVPPPPSLLPDIFPCTIAAVRLFADPKTDEPYATVSLVPGPHRDPADAAPSQDHSHRGFCYYAKQLTQSDANNGGGFSVPRSCADLVFPPLDSGADPPVQTLRMRDLLGARWEFRHIYRAHPSETRCAAAGDRRLGRRRGRSAGIDVRARRRRATAASAQDQSEREAAVQGP